MGKMLTMQQSGVTFPDAYMGFEIGVSLVVVKEPTEGQHDWSQARKEPGGSDGMREAGQATPGVGKGAVRSGHGGVLLCGHPQVSPGPVPKNSILLANLKQMHSHFRMADGKRGWTEQEIRERLGSEVCSLFKVQV